MITLKEAKQRQDGLQKQAKALLEHFQIIEKLKPLGEVGLYGSYLYGLMVQPDIDIEVSTDHPDLDDVSTVAQFYIKNERINRVMVTSKYLSRHDGTPGRPPGIYLGISPYWEGREWNLDIWIMPPQNKLDQENFPSNWHAKLTDKQRESILLLKYNLSQQRRYPGTKDGQFLSADIYRAVMNDGVKSIEELDDWRKTHPYY